MPMVTGCFEAVSWNQQQHLHQIKLSTSNKVAARPAVELLQLAMGAGQLCGTASNNLLQDGAAKALLPAGNINLSKPSCN